MKWGEIEENTFFAESPDWAYNNKKRIRPKAYSLFV